MEADGFTHTIHLDCGCRIRLNFPDRECDWKPGYWIACTRGHSATEDYDPTTGEPNPARDRQVTEVVAEPFDGSASGT